MIFTDDKGNKHYIYAIYYVGKEPLYWYCDFGFDSIAKFTKRSFKSDFIYKFESDDILASGTHLKCISESKYLDASYYNFGYGSNFSDEQEKKEFYSKMKNFEAEIPIINERIEIDYIQWKIKNNVLDEWDNEFEDRIIELSNTERYIDDKEYDIFYDINNLDNIKVTKKRSL